MFVSIKTRENTEEVKISYTINMYLAVIDVRREMPFLSN